MYYLYAGGFGPVLKFSVSVEGPQNANQVWDEVKLLLDRPGVKEVAIIYDHGQGEKVATYRKRVEQAARSAFTLVETLVALAIILFLVALGVGASVKVLDWHRRGATERTIRKVYERTLTARDRIVREAREWETPTALLRRAGGSPRRAEVLKVKYLLKWSYPESFAEVAAFLAESRAVYLQDGYPPLAALRERIGTAVGAPSPAEQNAILLALIYGGTVGGSEGGLAPHEVDPRFGLPMVVDAWGMPLAFRLWTAGPLLFSLDVDTDPDDPDGLLLDRSADPVSPDPWWPNNAAWFFATFRYDPQQPYVGLVVVSSGPDKLLATAEDNIHSQRKRTP